MPDSTQIGVLVAFELMLLVGTLVSIARRRVLFTGTRGTGLPVSLPALALAVVALSVAVELLGGAHPVVAIVLIVSIAASWIVTRRFGGHSARPDVALDRRRAIDTVVTLIVGYLVTALLAGGGFYFLSINSGMTPEKARTVVAVILAILAFQVIGICLSMLRRRP